MKFKNYLQSITDVGIYPVTTLLIFFIFFTLLTIWACRARKEHLDVINNIPLDGGEISNELLP
jgi:hypothetical protein